MPKRIFVTATNTDIGKTYTSLALIESFSRLGLRVGAFKAIETGVVEGRPLDGSRLLEAIRVHNSAFDAFTTADIVPMQFPLPAAPFVANEARGIDLACFDEPLAKIEAHCDVVIIEGAGGLMVPVDTTTMMIDLPGYFNATTLLVSHCHLGCINDTLLSINALEERKLPFVWALNCREGMDAFNQTSRPYFEYRFGSFLTVQHDIDRIAQALLDTIAR